MKKLLATALLSISAAIFAFAPLSYAANNNTIPSQGDYGINVPTDNPQQGGEPGLVTSIKKGINIVLTFLGLIALIILLYGGFMMVTAAGDETKYKKGFTILRQSAIGLIFIGLSALFVNLIFWLIGSIT